MRQLIVLLVCCLTGPAALAEPVIRFDGPLGGIDLRLAGLTDGTHLDLTEAYVPFRISRNPRPSEEMPCDKGADPVNPYPFQVLHSRDVTMTGGAFDGQVPLGTAWHFTYCNSTAIRFAESPGARISGVRIMRAWDAVRLSEGARKFTISGSWMSQVRDDCIENDFLLSGEIRDVLFDGCFSGISIAPSDDFVEDDEPPEIELNEVLMRMEIYLYRDEWVHALPFKVRDAQVQLSMHDSIIAVESSRMIGQKHAENMWQTVADCSNNLLLWLGDEAMPDSHRPPQDCFTVLEGYRAKAAWTTARKNWIDCHPRAVRFTDDDLSEPSQCNPYRKGAAGFSVP